MKRNVRNTLVALGAVTAIAGFTVPTYAIDFNLNLGGRDNDVGQIDNRALHHIWDARHALENGDRDRALDQVQRAENDLTNAQYAGDPNAPRALHEVREAQHRLWNYERDRAFASLDHATDILQS